MSRTYKNYDEIKEWRYFRELRHINYKRHKETYKQEVTEELGASYLSNRDKRINNIPTNYSDKCLDNVWAYYTIEKKLVISLNKIVGTDEDNDCRYRVDFDNKKNRVEVSPWFRGSFKAVGACYLPFYLSINSKSTRYPVHINNHIWFKGW